MDIITPQHFSLTDWDFQPDKQFNIVTNQYVSSPSSLARPITGAINTTGWCYLKTALGANIPEGRITAWTRAHISSMTGIAFWARTQLLPVGDLAINSYYADIQYNNAYIYKRVSSSNTTLASVAMSPPLVLDTWYRFRFTWYNWLTADLASVLALIVERWVADAWVTILTYNDTSPLWDASATNRIGFHVQGINATNPCWVDDTIIEERV